MILRTALVLFLLLPIGTAQDPGQGKEPEKGKPGAPAAGKATGNKPAPTRPAPGRPSPDRSKALPKAPPGSGPTPTRPRSFPGLSPRRQPRPAPRNPLLGSWEVKQISGLSLTARFRGYLVITPLYVSFHMVVQNGRNRPDSHSGFWRYTVQGNRMHFHKLLETGVDRRRSQPERTTFRRFQFVGGMLRLSRPDGSFLALRRLE